MEENLLVDGFGKENNISDERKKLYELFLRKKALSAVREFQPLKADGFGSEETKSKASSKLPADQISQAPSIAPSQRSRVSKAPSYASKISKRSSVQKVPSIAGGKAPTRSVYSKKSSQLAAAGLKSI